MRALLYFEKLDLYSGAGAMRPPCHLFFLGGKVKTPGALCDD